MAAQMQLLASQRAALHVGPTNGLPHDPLALVLYGRYPADLERGFAVGSLDGVVIQRCPPSLILAPAQGAGRSLTEDSGSFGGLKLPTSVAVASDGSVFLIDRTRGIVKYFDPCDCAFKPLPCLTGATPAVQPPVPRKYTPLTELAGPAGLAIAGTSLLVTDPGHHRVVVFGLIGLVPRGTLRLPVVTGFRQAWKPFAVAADSHRTVYVSAPDLGRIDLFGHDGRWLKAFEGLGTVTHLAVDCNDVLLAVIADYSRDPSGRPVAAAVEVVDGTVTPLTDDPGALAGRFPPPTLAVDRAGRIDLSATCGTAGSIFDLDGYPVAAEQKTATAQYLTSGDYLSSALDSGRLGCVWHRVVLACSIPAGTQVAVQTTTSDVELDAAELADLAPADWTLPVVLDSDLGGIADALVQSPPGQYLWLRLSLSGTGTNTPSIVRIIVEFPRVSLRRYLPGVYGMDAASADFTDRFTSLFDTTLRSIENRLDTLPEYFDPRTTPADRSPSAPPGTPDFLSWLALWIGVRVPRSWPEPLRRAMVRTAACFNSMRGTRTGLHQLLLTFLGFRPKFRRATACPARCTPVPLNCAAPAPEEPLPDPPLILEHFCLRRWLFLGAGRLGDDATLWGQRIVNRSQLGNNARLGPLNCPPDRQPATRLDVTPDPLRDPFLVCANRFSVFVPARVRSRDWQRRGLEQLLATESPAHTQWDIHYVEPRFRVGVQALIGLDSVIARVPCGVTLGDNRLGQGTVLPPEPGRPVRIGRGARVGETVRLQ